MYDLFPHVNDDVGIEVMTRLSFSSLLRFRKINKSWRDIIDSPFFRKLHIENQLSSHNHHDDDPLLIKLHHTVTSIGQCFQELSILHLNTQKSYNHFPLYQDFLNDNIFTNSSPPVHGLICFYTSTSTNPIALCNPSLGEIKILPSPTPSLSYRRRLVGLGYDDLEKGYKIVQFSEVESRPYPVVEVYSRKRNTWRVLADHTVHKSYSVWNPLLQHVQPSSAVVAHWIGTVEDAVDGISRFYDAIISFDMRSDALKMMKISCVEYSKIIKIFAKEDSSFTMLAYPVDSAMSDMINIWEYKREWIKVGILRLLSHVPTVWPVAIWKSNGLILKIRSEKTKLLLYDIKTGEIVKRFNFPSIRDSGFNFIEYKGSFISP